MWDVLCQWCIYTEPFTHSQSNIFPSGASCSGCISLWGSINIETDPFYPINWIFPAAETPPSNAHVNREGKKKKKKREVRVSLKNVVVHRRRQNMKCMALAAAERSAPYLEATAATSAYSCWQHRTAVASSVSFMATDWDGAYSWMAGPEIFCVVMFSLSIKPWFRCLISFY